MIVRFLTPTALVVVVLHRGRRVPAESVSSSFSWARIRVLKRRWFPRFTILVGVLFVIFSTTIMVLGSQWMTAGQNQPPPMSAGSGVRDLPR